MTSSTRTCTGARRRAAMRALPAALAASATLAACGGGGGEGGGTGPGSRSARLNVTVQAALASGATNLSLRVTPTYARTGGAVVPLAQATPAFTAGSTQPVPVDVDLTSCLADAQRAPATANTCATTVAVTLLSGTTVIDSVSVGPLNLTGGSTTAVPVSFAQVASIQLTRQGGAALGTSPVPLLPQQTLPLAATVLGTAGTPISRPVTWSVSPAGVATVDANGLVTATGFGTAQVTASAGGRSASVTVLVRSTLTVTLAGAGAGTVTSTDQTINCSAANAAGCTAAYDPQAGVVLSAQPDGNSTFSGWSGACTGTGGCVVPMTGNQQVTATFARRRVTVTLTAGAGGTVTVTGGNVAPATTCSGTTCSYTVDAGATVNLTATPTAGNTAGPWTGACASTTTGQACARSFTADAAVGVTFVTRPPPDTVNGSFASTVPGATFGGTLFPSGTLNGNPTSATVVFTVTTGQPLPPPGLFFDQNSAVTLQFQPNATSRVVSWGGACAGAPVNADPGGVSTCVISQTGRSTQFVINLGPR